MINVITQTQIVFKIFSGIVTPSPINQFTHTGTKFSEANALPKKPANVMATCMVERNFAGFFVRAISRLALLSPSLLILSSFTSLMESTAISAQANTAFNAINIICNITAPNMFFLPRYYAFYFLLVPVRNAFDSLLHFAAHHSQKQYKKA